MSELQTYLAYKTGVIAQRREEFSADPAKALVPLRAVSTVAGMTGARPTQSGDFHLLTDSARGLGGHGLGPSAPQLLMASLASCLAHTYLINAVLLGIPLDGVEVEVTGSLDMRGALGLPAPEPTHIAELSYRASLQSTADAETLARLHEAVDATCPVLNTLRLPASITRKD